MLNLPSSAYALRAPASPEAGSLEQLKRAISPTSSGLEEHYKRLLNGSGILPVDSVTGFYRTKDELVEARLGNTGNVKISVLEEPTIKLLEGDAKVAWEITEGYLGISSRRLDIRRKGDPDHRAWQFALEGRNPIVDGIAYDEQNRILTVNIDGSAQVVQNAAAQGMDLTHSSSITALLRPSSVRLRLVRSPGSAFQTAPYVPQKVPSPAGHPPEILSPAEYYPEILRRARGFLNPDTKGGQACTTSDGQYRVKNFGNGRSGGPGGFQMENLMGEKHVRVFHEGSHWPIQFSRSLSVGRFLVSNSDRSDKNPMITALDYHEPAGSNPNATIIVTLRRDNWLIQEESGKWDRQSLKTVQTKFPMTIPMVEKGLKLDVRIVVESAGLEENGDASSVEHWLESHASRWGASRITVVDPSIEPELERLAIGEDLIVGLRDKNFFVPSKLLARAKDETHIISQQLPGAPDQKQLADELSRGIFQGREVYAILYRFDGQIGIQLTDDLRVVLAAFRMANVIDSSSLHGVAEFPVTFHTSKIPEGGQKRVWQLLDLQTTFAIGVDYPGDSLAFKKLAMRRLNYLLQKSGETSRVLHMATVRVTDVKGEERYVGVIAPTNGGKTVMAMLPPSDEHGIAISPISDDLSVVTRKGGRIYAKNPENGVFATLSGSTPENNPRLYEAIRRGGVLLYGVATNPAMGEWWIPELGDPPESMEDWLDWNGNPVIDWNTAYHRSNARAVIPQKNFSDWHEPSDPDGVPLDALLIGGVEVENGQLIQRAETTQAGLAAGMAAHDLAMREFLVTDRDAFGRDVGALFVPTDTPLPVFLANWAGRRAENHSLFKEISESLAVAGQASAGLETNAKTHFHRILSEAGITRIATPDHKFRAHVLGGTLRVYTSGYRRRMTKTFEERKYADGSRYLAIYGSGQWVVISRAGDIARRDPEPIIRKIAYQSSEGVHPAKFTLTIRRDQQWAIQGREPQFPMNFSFGKENLLVEIVLESDDQGLSVSLLPETGDSAAEPMAYPPLEVHDFLSRHRSLLEPQGLMDVAVAYARNASEVRIFPANKSSKDALMTIYVHPLREEDRSSWEAAIRDKLLSNAGLPAGQELPIDIRPYPADGHLSPLSLLIQQEGAKLPADPNRRVPTFRVSQLQDLQSLSQELCYLLVMNDDLYGQVVVGALQFEDETGQSYIAVFV